MNEKIKAAIEREADFMLADRGYLLALLERYDKWCRADERAKKWEESHGMIYFECREQADRLFQELLG